MWTSWTGFDDTGLPIESSCPATHSPSTAPEPLQGWWK